MRMAEAMRREDISQDKNRSFMSFVSPQKVILYIKYLFLSCFPWSEGEEAYSLHKEKLY